MDSFNRINHMRYITKVEGGAIVRSKYKHIDGHLVKHHTVTGHGTTSKMHVPSKPHSHTSQNKEHLLNDTTRIQKL